MYRLKQWYCTLLFDLTVRISERLGLVGLSCTHMVPCALMLVWYMELWLGSVLILRGLSTFFIVLYLLWIALPY